MKTAIYIEDSVTQIVLTPENDFEKSALAKLKQKELSVKLHDGQFYECQGGWNRESIAEKSLMIRVEEPTT